MRKVIVVVVFTLCIINLSGCNQEKKELRAQVDISEYDKINYETVSVMRGDITPTLILSVKSDTFERKHYYSKLDEMEVEQVHVANGDVVTDGQVLVSFKSGDIQEKIKEHEKTLAENQLLLEHYKKLSEIDASTDYSEDIKLLNQDIYVNSLYIQELNAKLDSFSIKAEGDGVVAMVSNVLDYGIVNSSDRLITVIYGDGNYYSYVEDDFEFEVGKMYEASYGNQYYSLKLQSIENTEKKGERKLNFVMDLSGITGTDMMTMTLNKPTLKDVLYVSEDAIFYVGQQAYVYTLDENGYRNAVEVELGQTIEGLTIISNGLNEGDKVVAESGGSKLPTKVSNDE